MPRGPYGSETNHRPQGLECLHEYAGQSTTNWSTKNSNQYKPSSLSFKPEAGSNPAPLYKPWEVRLIIRPTRDPKDTETAQARVTKPRLQDILGWSSHLENNYVALERDDISVYVPHLIFCRAMLPKLEPAWFPLKDLC